MMARRDKRVEEMRAFLNLLDQLRDINLTLGDDSRNRFWSRPLLSITARNQPSTAENILSYPKWLRGCITPPEGWAIVVIDYSNQETLIAAGQSGDTTLAKTCEGDRHLQVAIALGFAPEGATKDSHPAERNRAKPLNHGSAYGVSAWGISEQLGCSLREAQQMIDEYDRTFHVFRAWQTRLVERALLFGRITAAHRLVDAGDGAYLGPNADELVLQTLGAQMSQAAAVEHVLAGRSALVPGRAAGGGADRLRLGRAALAQEDREDGQRADRQELRLPVLQRALPEVGATEVADQRRSRCRARRASLKSASRSATARTRSPGR